MKEYENILNRIVDLKNKKLISDADFQCMVDNLNIINVFLQNYKKDMLSSYQEGFKCAIDSLNVAYESISNKINNK